MFWLVKRDIFDYVYAKTVILAVVIFLFGKNQYLTALAVILIVSMIIQTIRQLQNTLKKEVSPQELIFQVKETLWRYIAYMFALILANQISKFGMIFINFASAIQLYISMSESLIAFKFLESFGFVFPISLERFLKKEVYFNESIEESVKTQSNYTDKAELKANVYTDKEINKERKRVKKGG